MKAFRTESRRRALPPLHPLAACLASALLMHGALLGAATRSAAAPHGGLVVTNCDDSGSGSLRDAIANAVDGDVIDLSAAGCPAITLTGGALAIAAGIANLTVNGPGQSAFSISGDDASRIFEHQGTGTLTLSGLTLTHGAGADSGGCVLANGNLTLSGVTLSACAAGNPTVTNNGGGGAAVLGSATLTDAHFSDNTVDGNLRVRGGALSVGGALSATGSTFTNNRATSHEVGGGTAFSNVAEGGAILALGDIDLTDSTVSGNIAKSDTAEAFGGGISAGSHPDDAAVSLEVLRSEISGNAVDSTCGVCAPQGGGIAAVGIVRLRQTLLLNNRSGSTGQYGGAGGMRVFDSASTEIDASTISGNHADSAGGGVLGPEQGVLAINGSFVTNNFAGNAGGTDEGGGGVLCFGCSIQLSSSTVSGNIAEANGGGIGVLFGEYAPAPMAIINSTVSGNTAKEGGGVMVDGGNAGFHNSTIAFNTAASRGAGISASEYSYQLDLQSTIVANNLTGSASNNVWAFPETVSGANNLVPNAGGPAAMPGDTLTGDPLLLPLADNGGATPTHALGKGSPAVDAGNDAIGLVFDQRGEGFAREVGAAADIGAYEQQAATDTDVIFKDGFDG